jgi:hypothetical protein
MIGTFRSLGGSIGIAMGQTIISSVRKLLFPTSAFLQAYNHNLRQLDQTLKKKISRIQGLQFDTSPQALSQSVGKLKSIAVSRTRCFWLMDVYME